MYGIFHAVIESAAALIVLNGNTGNGKDAYGMPVRVAVTAGTIADCTQATALIDGIVAQFLLADRGYDTNEIIDKAIASGCKIVIPPKKESQGATRV